MFTCLSSYYFPQTMVKSKIFIIGQFSSLKKKLREKKIKDEITFYIILNPFCTVWQRK